MVRLTYANGKYYAGTVEVEKWDSILLKIKVPGGATIYRTLKKEKIVMQHH